MKELTHENETTPGWEDATMTVLPRCLFLALLSTLLACGGESPTMEGYWIGAQEHHDGPESSHVFVLGIKRLDDHLAATTDGVTWYPFAIDTGRTVNWLDDALAETAPDTQTSPPELFREAWVGRAGGSAAEKYTPDNRAGDELHTQWRGPDGFLRPTTYYRIPNDSVALLLLQRQASSSRFERLLDSSFIAFSDAIAMAATQQLDEYPSTAQYVHAVLDALKRGPELADFVVQVDSTTSSSERYRNGYRYTAYTVYQNPAYVVLTARNGDGVVCTSGLFFLRNSREAWIADDEVPSETRYPERYGESWLRCGDGVAPDGLTEEERENYPVFENEMASRGLSDSASDASGGPAYEPSILRFEFNRRARMVFAEARRRAEASRQEAYDLANQATGAPSASRPSGGPSPEVLLACAREVDPGAYAFSSGPEWRAALPSMYDNPSVRDALTTAYIRCINSYR